MGDISAADGTRPSGKPDIQDSIVIRNARTGLDSHQFFSLLKRQIRTEVDAGASPQTLDDLKRQIALNDYSINPSDIARRMMLDDSIEVTND